MGTRSFVHTFLHSRQTGARNTRLQWISFDSAIAVALSCGVPRSDSSSSSVPAVGTYLAACGFVKKPALDGGCIFYGSSSGLNRWRLHDYSSNLISSDFRSGTFAFVCVAGRLFNAARHFYRKSNMLTAVLCILIFTYSPFLAFSCFVA